MAHQRSDQCTIAKFWKQQTVPAFVGMTNRNILRFSKIGKKCAIYLYFGFLAPENSFASAKIKSYAFAKNCLAMHAKAQSIVHILCILHISRRTSNWKRCCQNLKHCRCQEIIYQCKVKVYKSRGELLLWNRILDLGWFLASYSSVPNRRIGPNKRAGGKILKKH